MNAAAAIPKDRRQRAILDLVEGEDVTTQEDLVRRLAARGVRVTQSTVSRDVRELGLVRVPQPGGGYRYATPSRVVSIAERHLRMLREFVREVDGSGSMAAVKTDPGNAHAVGVALDHLELTDVVGTVAGDDTLLVLLREHTDWHEFRDRFLELLQ